MSEMHSIEIDFNDEEILLEALRNMGYCPKVNNDGILMDTYYQEKIKPKAHIIIDRAQVGGYAAVGFERDIKGGYHLHMDSMDGHRFKLNKLKQNYAEGRIKKVIKGKSKYSIRGRTEENGQIKMKIRCNLNH